MAKTGVEYTGICHISVGSNLNPERNIIRLALHEIGLIVPDPDIRNRPFLVAGLLDLNPTIDLPDNPGVMKGLARTPEVRQLQVARSFSIAIKERFTT